MYKKTLTKINRFKKSDFLACEYALVDADAVTVCTLQSRKNGLVMWYIASHAIDVSGQVLAPIGEIVRIGKKFEISDISGPDESCTIDTSGGSFSFSVPELNIFPSDYEYDPDHFFAEIESESMKSLGKSSSDDDLRPGMQGVYIGADAAVATDGHRMIWDRSVTVPEGHELTIPVDAIDLMGADTYRICTAAAGNGSRYYALHSEAEAIIFQEVPDQFPDWQTVIPRDEPAQSFSMPVKSTLKAAEAAQILCAGKAQQVSFEPAEDGSLTLEAVDLDTSQEYKSACIGSWSSKEDDPFRVAFNSVYLAEAMRHFKNEGRDSVEMTMTAATKAAIIEDHFLLMPVMLRDYAV